MATVRKTLQINGPDANTPIDRVSNQITATNPIGNFIAYVLSAGVGADHGIYFQGEIPQDYDSTPKLVVRGILAGAPGASDVLGFGTTGLALADNEASDQAFGSEDAASATIGSSGLGYSDEDELELVITLTNLGTLAPGDSYVGYVYWDDGTTTYAGKFLLTSVQLQYATA